MTTALRFASRQFHKIRTKSIRQYSSDTTVSSLLSARKNVVCKLPFTRITSRVACTNLNSFAASHRCRSLHHWSLRDQGMNIRICVLYHVDVVILCV
jgi:hypothetical protein